MGFLCGFQPLSLANTTQKAKRCQKNLKNSQKKIIKTLCIHQHNAIQSPEPTYINTYICSSVCLTIGFYLWLSLCFYVCWKPIYDFERSFIFFSFIRVTAAAKIAFFLIECHHYNKSGPNTLCFLFEVFGSDSIVFIQIPKH